MSARSLRRAAERQALKAARERNASPRAAVETVEAEPNPISQAQLDANRANSLNSTGPRTAEGLAAVRLNAVKTALTGQTVLLPSDDAVLYQAHILDYEKQFKPLGPEECALVQSIADIRWRLSRIPALEISLMSRGRLEFGQNLPETPDAGQTALLDLEIMEKYEKQLRNLHLQEARLARRREKEIAELRSLQQERKANEAAALEHAATAYLLARQRNQPADPPQIGFEFSKETFASYIAALTPARKQELLQKASAEPTETMQAAA